MDVSVILLAVGPFIALIVGMISLLYEKGNSHARWPKPVLLTALVATFAVEVMNKHADRLESTTARTSLDRKNTDLGKALASFEDKTVSRLEQLLKRFPEKLAEATAAPVAPTTVRPQEEGYAYYGISGAEGKWLERYFDRVGNDPVGLPKPGDEIKARGPVNARAGYIEFDSESGWTNKRIIGAIRPGDRLNVLEVNPILGSYIWIKFRRVS